MKDNTTSTREGVCNVVSTPQEASLSASEKTHLLRLGRRIKAGGGFGIIRRKGAALRLEQCKIVQAQTF